MATTENYVLKDGQLVPDESVTTRTNVGKVPNLDIQVKPMITDNIGSDLSTQAAPDIDWNQNQNIINVGGFRGFGKRKALRDALNANKNTLIWNGNGFQRANTGLGADKWSRRDVRRLMRSYNDNWSTYNNKVPLEGNNANYAAYLSENYLANNPTATNFRWTAGKYPQQQVEAQQNEIQTNDVQEPIKEPSFYGELRNGLQNLTQKANENIIGQYNIGQYDKRKDANLAMKFAANKKAYEDAINNNNQGSKPQTSATPQLGQIEAQTSEEYIPTRQDYQAQYANIVTNPTNDNAVDRFESVPFNYNERRYINDLDSENFLTFDEIRTLAKRNNQDYKDYAKQNGFLWDRNSAVYRKSLKQGGVMTYQQGGTFNQQESDQDEKLMQAALFGFIGQNPDADTKTAIETIAQAYMQDPNSLSQIIQDQDSIKKGINIMKQREPEVLQYIVKPGALKTIINKFLQQGIKQAKMGTKLDYIKQLKNICPEGYEIEFRKAGGTVCPVCKKKHKAQKAQEGNKIEKECKGGISKAMDGIKAQMKCGGKVKKEQKGGQAIKSPRQKVFEERDSLVKRMNQYPNEGTADSLAISNQKVGKYLDSAEEDTTGPKLNNKAIEFMKKRKLKQVPIRTQK